MSLADRLQYPAADEPEYTPRVEFDGSRGFIDTGAIQGEVPKDLSPVFRECLIAAGYDPETVRIGKMLKQSHWQQRARKRVWSDESSRYVQTHEFETVWLHCYKFETFLDGASAADELDAFVQAAKALRPSYTQGGYWVVFQAGDLQLGKRSAAGATQEIIDRYMGAVEAATRQIRQLKRFGVEGIQVSMPGDCIEGTVSQNGKNMGTLTAETAPEQTRILRRLMYETVEAMAPLANQVKVDVVNGNHDQAQRQLNTYPGDGWATECAIEVGDRLGDNPGSFGHVEVRVPDKWRGCMTVPVGDSVVTVVHGHQWRRDKAMQWWSEQALGLLPAGGAQVLQHGHWHEWMVRSTADRTVVASPTFDCGSDWYQENHGGTSRRGGLVYLLRRGEVSRMTLV
ncbi:hypothetical protein B5566_02360 [Mycobacterium sp. MHSD3]|nr:hypothetical protein B5566_02360 [Mycobacterium sp. MHSD3]